MANIQSLRGWGKNFVFFCVTFTIGACFRGDRAPSRSWDLQLTGVGAVERSIHYKAYAYLPVDADETFIHMTLARIARSVIGPMRAEKIAASHREPIDGVTVDERAREYLTVVDPDHPDDSSHHVLRVWFHFDDRVAASNHLAEQNSVELTLLMADASTRGDELVRACSEDPFVETESLWYYFHPKIASCQRLITEERLRITEEEKKIRALRKPADRFVAMAEVERSFQTVQAQLGPAVTHTRTYYPEYDRLFGGQNAKEKLVVYLFTGVDVSTSYFGDRFLMEYFRAMRELLSSYPQMRGELPGGKRSLLDFAALGGGGAEVTYEDLFTWILDDRGYPRAVRSDQAKIVELRDEARAKFVEKWAYWTIPIKVTHGTQSPRRMEVEIRSFYGDDSGTRQAAEAAHARYREAFQKADAIIYNGHSHLGSGVLDPTHYKTTDFNDRYQVFFINSCSSFPYFGEAFMNLKPGRSKNLDVVVNGLKSGIARSGTVVAKFIEDILAVQSYSEMLSSMREAGCCEFDEMRLVDGELDNDFNPKMTPLVVRARP